MIIWWILGVSWTTVVLALSALIAGPAADVVYAVSS